MRNFGASFLTVRQEARSASYVKPSNEIIERKPPDANLNEHIGRSAWCRTLRTELECCWNNTGILGQMPQMVAKTIADFRPQNRRGLLFHFAHILCGLTDGSAQCSRCRLSL
jgi:hypothetical protein